MRFEIKKIKIDSEHAFKKFPEGLKYQKELRNEWVELEKKEALWIKK